MNTPASLKRPGKEGGGMGIKRNLMIIQITIILRSAIVSKGLEKGRVERGISGI